MKIRNLIIVFVIFLTLKEVVDFFFKNEPKNSSVIKSEQKIITQKNNTPLIKIKKNEHSNARENDHFLEKEIQVIKNCLPNFSSNSPESLKDFISPAESEINFLKENLHYKNNQGNIFQQRAEGSPTNLSYFYYKKKDGIPFIISKEDFDQEISNSKLIYEEKTTKTKNSEIIKVNNEIIKIESNNKNSSLGCELIDGRWECFCFKKESN